tara:strand:- start:80 stop:1471 length:1392 start_codon:yes stop_codon:yes gene_type:complete
MATTYLRKTPGGSGNQRKFTFSFWVKKNSVNPAGTYTLFDCGTSTNYFHIYFPDTHTLTVKSRASNSTVMELVTTRVFRDPNAWYNFVIAVDSEQGTAADRCKIYVNGVQETSFSTASYGNQNQDHEIQDTGSYHYIGTNYAVNADEFFDGSMSYVAFVDGTQELPTIFGETDTATGEWKIKTSVSPSSAWGSNGFLILKDGNSVTDQSGQSNNWTVQAGTLTKTEDNPSNNFCTYNQTFLTRHHNESTSIPGMLQNGNTTFNSTANAFYGFRAGSIGVLSGKYYWENKIIDKGRMYIGICYPDILNRVDTPFYDSSIHMAITLDNSGSIQGINGDSSASGVSFDDNDIIGFALDMDNKGLYVHKNGTYVLSGNPASGASLTGSVIEPLSGTKEQYLGNGEFVAPLAGDPSSSGTFLVNSNFGNGYFGSTQISSAGTNASGLGIFEFDVPAGFSALCTKGLNE